MDANIQQFIAITGKDAKEAKFFLEMSNGDLQRAINACLDPGNVPSTPPSRSSHKPSTSKSNISGFGSLNTDDGVNRDDQNEYYTGGSKNSGTAVFGGPNERKPNELVDKLINNAKAVQPPPPNSKPSPFGGAGRRLGVDPEEPSPMSTSSGKSQQKKEIKKVKITFWLEGFTVDDGELRRYDDPKNKKMLEQMDRGYAPMEISQGHDIDCQVVDKKSESYKPPPKVFKAFSGGKGRSLASSPSTTVSNSSGPTQPKGSNYKCDTSKPHTTLQIVLPGGVRFRQQFNMSDSIRVVKQFILDSKPLTGSQFDLTMTYPRKVLDESQTLEGAGLKNASVIVKMK